MAFNLFKKKDKKEAKPGTEPVVSEQPEPKTEAKEAAVPLTALAGVSVLKHMHVSEKSAHGEQMNQYTFIVVPTATKSEIAKEVQRRYKVDVTAVNVTRLPGKKRRLGRFTGSTNSKKKATVTLRAGQRIVTA